MSSRCLVGGGGRAALSVAVAGGVANQLHPHRCAGAQLLPAGFSTSVASGSSGSPAHEHGQSAAIARSRAGATQRDDGVVRQAQPAQPLLPVALSVAASCRKDALAARPAAPARRRLAGAGRRQWAKPKGESMAFIGK